MGAVLGAWIGANANIRAAAATGVSETWTGTTGAAWPSQWTKQDSSSNGATGSATTIQTNQGRIVTTAAGFAGAGTREVLTGMTAQSDTNVIVSFTPRTAAGGIYISVADSGVVRSATNDVTSLNGYYLSLGMGSSTSALLLQIVGGTSTTIGSIVTKTFTSGTQYKARLQRTGTTLQFRTWAAASAEPSTWDNSGTISGGLTGKVMLAVSCSSASTAASCDFDDLTVT